MRSRCAESKLKWLHMSAEKESERLDALAAYLRVEGRIEPEHVSGEQRKREKAGIGTEDEDLGEEGNDTGAVDLPKDMVERLRVDLSIWKPERIDDSGAMQATEK